MTNVEHVSYKTGRRTFKGVEICEYYSEGKPAEKVVVVAHAAGERIAAVICNYLNQRMNAPGATLPVSKAEPLPGGY